VVPGLYRVEMVAGAERATGNLEVREDPRITVPADVRRAWTATLLELGTLRRETRALAGRAQVALRGLGESAPAARRRDVTELARETGELAGRAGRLYGSATGEVAPLTELQREQRAYYQEMLAELSRAATTLRIP
jgi:hypothetical protein